MRLASNLNAREQATIVGVGNSGTAFARRINPDATGIAVQTLAFNRDRLLRKLLVMVNGDVDEEAVLVDDVAVSGRTFEAVAEVLSMQPQVAGLGLLYDSKRTLQRIGVPDVRYGLLYARQGGGVPPMNCVRKLRAMPERLEEYVDRYMQGSRLFLRVLSGISSRVTADGK